MGGTGATLVLCLMFCFLAKSKEMRAVGRASIVPVCFAVNEPFLFGAPMVLNPVFFAPFIAAPVLNIWLLKIFVDVLGMNGFMYTLPWTTPAPIGIIMGLGLQPLAFVFLIAILALDFAVYSPFFKVYDRQKCEEESEVLEEELAERAAQKDAAMTAAFQGEVSAESVAAGAAASTVAGAAAASSSAGSTSSTPVQAGDLSSLSGKGVLVLCQGGGTSGLLANALAKGAEAYGNHIDMMPDFDLVVLAPQTASYYDDLKKDADRMGIKCCSCRGKQYIDLSRDGEAALNFVLDQLAQ